MRIFISYKRADEPFARDIHMHIHSWGYTSWLDVVNIRPGEDWDSSIHAGLKTSDIVLGLLTPESLASDNVLDEWGYALSTGKRLFLLWLRDVPEADIPPRYIRIQRIDCRQNRTEGMKHLRDALESDAKVIPLGINTQTNIPSASSDSPSSGMAQIKEAIASQIKTNRERMLEKVYTFWVKGVLEQSLYGSALIELGLQHTPGMVQNPWDTVLQHPQYGDYRLPRGTKPISLFRDLNNELLILGDPGSGKTTTLIELARDLIVEAQADEKQPIPVIFNLSSWADERKPLAVWLVNELNAKYQVPRKTAEDWVEADTILLLLDGLDEVDIRYRDTCVMTINQYREDHGFTPIIVCSRILDYEVLSNRLRLNGAIVLQPLTDEQIDSYFVNLRMETLRRAMTSDPNLRELANTPLILSIMTLAYQGLTDLPELDSIEAHREHLLSVYVKRMFERRATSSTYTPEQTRQYLIWLAARMVERKQSVFYIEWLQPEWLDIRSKPLAYKLRIVGILSLLFALIGGLFFGISDGAAIATTFGIAAPYQGIPFGLGYGFVVGMFAGLIPGLVVGVVMGIDFVNRGKIRIVDALSWSPARYRIGAFVFGLLSAFVLGSLIAIFPFFLEFLSSVSIGYPDSASGQDLKSIVVFLTSRIDDALYRLNIAALIGGITGGLVGGIISGFTGQSLEMRTEPNQGIRRSYRNALLLGLGTALAFEVFWMPLLVILSGPNVVENRLCGWPFIFLLAGVVVPLIGFRFMLNFGGRAAAKHAVLRFLLYRAGFTPRNYAHFLDYAAERIFLRKVGGGYIFIHRMLLEYFAGLEKGIQPLSSAK